MIQLPLKCKETSPIGLKPIQKSLQDNLDEFFETVKVELQPCPNLADAPFKFPIQSIAEGAIIDVGGPAYLVPKPNLSKKYSLDQLLDLCNILQVPNEVIFGACAGPFWELGRNSEMVACKQSRYQESDSFVGWVDEKSEKSTFKPICSNGFGLLGNFFVCSQEPESTVLKISVKKRKTDANFTKAVTSAISESFPKQVISLGGLFSVSNSTLNCHVMPDFSQTPLITDSMVNDWLKFYSFHSQMTFASVIHCHDPGLNLRMEHSHGFNEQTKQLGHYHYDLEPETVEYEGVFALATKVIRIDMPSGV